MVERLTERSKIGTAFFNDDGALIRGAGGAFRQKKDMTANFIHQRFVALDKAIDRLAAYEDAMPLERAQDLAQAEKDGRLVVLPCKPGQMVWTESPVRGLAYSFRAPDIAWIIENTERFGREIFLTREEAEAALKKMEEADNEAD